MSKQDSITPASRGAQSVPPSDASTSTDATAPVDASTSGDASARTDAGTTGDAATRTDAAARTDASAPADASARSSGSTGTVSTAAGTSSPSPSASASSFSPFSMDLSVLYGPASIGTGSSSFFNLRTDRASGSLAYRQTEVRLQANLDLNVAPFFRFGGYLAGAYRYLSGSPDAPTEIHGGSGTLGIRATLNPLEWLGFQIYAGGGFLGMTGRGTPPAHFAIDDVGGVGGLLEAGALARFRVARGVQVYGGYGIEHWIVPGARHSTGFPAENVVGVNHMARLGVEVNFGETGNAGPALCDGRETAESIRERIDTLLHWQTDPNADSSLPLRERRVEVGEIPALRRSYDHNRDLLRAMQGAWGEPTDTAPIVESVRSRYMEYLERRSRDTSVPAAERELIDSAAERQQLAREEYPDDMNPFNMAEVPSTEVPDPLPGDDQCTNLLELRNRLEIERDALDRENARIQGLIVGYLRGRGVSRGSEPRILRAITLLEFPSTNFLQARPRAADLAAATSYLSTFTTPVTSRDDVNARATQIANNATSRAIFPIPSAELRALAQVANILLGYDDPGTVRHSETGGGALSAEDRTAIRDILSHMPITIEAHASTEGDDAANQQLTQRRADVIRAYLVALGVPADRLTAVGYGESRPLISEIDDRGRALRGQQLESARNRNRRVVYRPDVARMDPTTGHMRTETGASGPMVPTTGDTAVPPPVERGSGGGDGGTGGDASR